jgi:hypothetical protein
MKDIEKKHKKELQLKDDRIKSLYNMVNIKNKELERLSLEHKYNLNNIDIIVRQSNYGNIIDNSRISIGIQEPDKTIAYAQIVNNNIFKTINIDKGKIITDIITRIVQNILHERGLI